MNNSTISMMSHFLFFSVAFSFALLAFALICGIGNGPYIFPLAMAISFVVLARVGGWRKAIKPTVWGLIIILLCIISSGLLSDYSYDGNFYHQEAVALLAQGWNPYDTDNLLSCENIWVRHYGIGIEMIASTIVCITGLLETGKAVNLIVIASAWGMVYTFVKQNTAAKKRTILLASIAIIGNPVVVCQMLTFYIDWAKYIYDIILLFSIYGFCKRWNWLDIFTGSAVIVLAVATKFNVWFEACMIVALTSLWLGAARQWRNAFKVAGWGLASVIVGMVICYHPYYHNYVIGGHVFYPLMGENNLDIMTNNTPQMFCHGRVVDFFRSLATKASPAYDQRVGGFGPLMLPILAVSLWIIFKSRKSVNKMWIYAAAIAFLSCFIFEQSWWARYICQLWFVPALALIIALKSPATRVLRVLRIILLSMMLLTTALMARYAGIQATYMAIYRHMLYNASPSFVINAYPQTLMHLHQHGVHPKSISAAEIHDGHFVVRFYDTPKPAVVLDSASYTKLVDNLNSVHIFSYDFYVTPLEFE